ncbi:MAG: Ig-like domain-containing protein [Clostridia bacterium]|nr:Ig-like domain-containing protein [Clostridia bacterium]
MKNKLIRTIAIMFISITMALGCISLIGCGDDEIQVKSISLNKNTLTLMEDQAETLIVTLDPNNADITWTSSDTTKVVVDKNGKVTGISATTSPVIVTATAGDKNATCAVSVTKYVPNYELSPSIDFDAYQLGLGEKEEFTEDTNLKDNVIYITASSDGKHPNMSSVSGSGYKFGKDDRIYYQSLKTQGKGSKENASIKLVLNKAAKIVVYCRNTSSKPENEYMPVSFYNTNFEKIEDQTYTVVYGEKKTELIFTTTKAGTYYFGTETGSLDIYGILIYYAI